MQEIENNIRVWHPPSQITSEEMERMKSDPISMYLYSLRTQSRLPEELHESMLVHSLDPASSANVRDYLEWVSLCEDRKERMAILRRREAMVDRMILGSMVMGMLGYVFLLFMVAIK
jgi:hypothetical protein